MPPYNLFLNGLYLIITFIFNKKYNLNEPYVLPPKKVPDVLFTFEADENSLSCEIQLNCYKEEDSQTISGRISVRDGMTINFIQQVTIISCGYKYSC